MSLIELKLGQPALITKIDCDKKLLKRLMALGCLEGTEIKVKRKAPLGDPIIVNFRGFDLALRKKDAKNIFIKEA